MFPCEFCAVYKNTLFLEHLWTAASQTSTEKGIGILAQGKTFLARGEKFILKSTHVISFIYLFIYLFIYFFFFSTPTTEFKFPAQAGNLHIIRPVDV